jgi:hypothetical protein
METVNSLKKILVKLTENAQEEPLVFYMFTQFI